MIDDDKVIITYFVGCPYTECTTLDTKLPHVNHLTISLHDRKTIERPKISWRKKKLWKGQLHHRFRGEVKPGFKHQQVPIHSTSGFILLRSKKRASRGRTENFHLLSAAQALPTVEYKFCGKSQNISMFSTKEAATKTHALKHLCYHICKEGRVFCPATDL